MLFLMWALEVRLGWTTQPVSDYRISKRKEKVDIKQAIEDRISGVTGMKEVSRLLKQEARRVVAQKHNDRIWQTMLGVSYTEGRAESVDWWKVGPAKEVTSQELLNMLKTIRNHTLQEVTGAFLSWVLKIYVGDDIKRFKEDVERCWNGADQGSLLEEILGIVREEINE